MRGDKATKMQGVRVKESEKSILLLIENKENFLCETRTRRHFASKSLSFDSIHYFNFMSLRIGRGVTI